MPTFNKSVKVKKGHEGLHTMDYDLARELRSTEDTFYIDACLKTLTSGEKIIFDMLKNSDHAMNTNTIHKKIIEDIFYHLDEDMKNNFSVFKNEDPRFYSILKLSQKDILQLRKEFKKYNVKYPSSSQVKSNLELMEKNNLLIKRHTPDDKTKNLWALNPKVRYYIEKREREEQKESSLKSHFTTSEYRQYLQKEKP